MKRFAVGFAWFLGLWVIAVVESGIIVGVFETAARPRPGPAARHAIAITIGDRLALTFFLVSLAVAVIGTITGFLPGTRRKRHPDGDP